MTSKFGTVRTIFVVWFGLSVWLLFLCLASRAAYYAFPDLPAPLAQFVEHSMQSQVVGFQSMLPTLVPQALVLVALGFGFAFWRRPFWERQGTSKTLRPWVYAFFGSFCGVNHYLFDADPLLAKLCWTTLALLAIGTAGGLEAEPSLLRRYGTLGVGVLFLGAGLLSSPTPVVTVGAVLWGLWLAILARWTTRGLRWLDACLLGLVTLPVCTFLIPSALIYVLPALRHTPGTALEERGYAYSFCERPETHTLFVAFPVGQTGDLERLRLGYVAEYDTRDLSKRAEHRFFDDEFYGGLRQLLCLGDVVQVTMNGVYLRGGTLASNVFEFGADDPSEYRISIFDEELRRERGWDLLGHVAAYDAASDAVFYTSEWTDTVFRLDRRSGQLDRRVGEALPPGPVRPVEFGLFVRAGSVHEGRRTLYLSEWLDGSRIHEMELDSLRVLRSFATGDTGSFGVVVDEGQDRLIASGLWGINVIDLESGRTVLRRRLGPGVRAAVVDTRRDLIFVPTTFGGHIWVFDRVSLAPLGRLTTGLGGRDAYLSHDGHHFFASDQNQVYRWDAEELERRFRGPP